MTTDTEPRRISMTSRNVAARKEMHRTLDAGGNGIWLYTTGCQRYAAQQVEQAAKEYDLGGETAMLCHTWDINNGCSDVPPKLNPQTQQMENPTCDPMAALDHIKNSQHDALYVLFDFHLLVNAQSNFALRRRLMQIAGNN
jgi:hypothetical protein